jgi:hypothetical protein
MKRALFVVILSVTAACARSTAASDDGTEPPVGAVSDTTTRNNDWSRIEQLEAQAKSLVKVDGCSSSALCKTAPVGSRACGGPRYYLTYCAKTTDSAALYRKLAEVAKAEQAFNTKYQIASTCEFRMPPAVDASGGVCKAT